MVDFKDGHRALTFFPAKCSLNACRNSTLRSLPVAVIGISSRMLHQFRHLEAAEMLSAMLGDPGFIGLRARLQLDEGGHRLAPLRMRQADHGGVLHGGMGEQRFLDLDGGDILAAGLDHVLLAVEEQHLAVFVDQREIAGVMPAEFARLFGRLRILVIAHHHVRPAMHQFAGLARAASRLPSSSMIAVSLTISDSPQ